MGQGAPDDPASSLAGEAGGFGPGSRIAGYRLEAQWVQCKCKLSQNRTAGDRANVARQLGASNDFAARAVSGWMMRLR